MGRKIGGLLGLLLLIGLLWYLLKPSDYVVTFKAKALPGVVNQSVKLWARSLDQAKLLNQKDQLHFTHQIQFHDSIFDYDWNIEPLNDSVSQVKVYVKDLNHSLANKLAIPFSETDFEKRTKSTLTDLLQTLQEHIGRFKVTVVGIDEIPSSYCAYVPIKSTQIEKANKMMEYYSLLDNLVANHNIRTNGKPFVEITDWNMEKDSITFNFCYPIMQSDSLPQHTIVKYKQFNGTRAIKALYNGNYITSDRAWYSLLHYAKKEGISVANHPVEIFYSNPNMGNDELMWKAEIFMPILAK